MEAGANGTLLAAGISLVLSKGNIPVTRNAEVMLCMVIADFHASEKRAEEESLVTTFIGFFLDVILAYS